MSTAVAIPEVEEDVRRGHESEDELARLYHVILLDDNDHTYEYVIEMLMEIFSFSEEKAYAHTVEVDTKGQRAPAAEHMLVTESREKARPDSRLWTRSTAASLAWLDGGSDRTR